MSQVAARPPIAAILAVSHPWDLSDEQFKAIRALQRGESAPRIDDHA